MVSSYIAHAPLILSALVVLAALVGGVAHRRLQVRMRARARADAARARAAADRDPRTGATGPHGDRGRRVPTAS